MNIYEEPLNDLRSDGVPEKIIRDVISYLSSLSEEEHSKIMLDKKGRLAITTSNESHEVLIQGKNGVYVDIKGDGKALYSDRNIRNKIINL